MENLRVFAKKLNSNEKIEGTGINIFDGQAFVYNKYVSYEVDPETILLRGSTNKENYENPKTDETLATKLHEKLVQTIIDFMVEHNIEDVDEVSFDADSLQISKMYKRWVPATDSSLVLKGYQDGKRKIIRETM